MNFVKNVSIMTSYLKIEVEPNPKLSYIVTFMYLNSTFMTQLG